MARKFPQTPPDIFPKPQPMDLIGTPPSPRTRIDDLDRLEILSIRIISWYMPHIYVPRDWEVNNAYLSMISRT